MCQCIRVDIHDMRDNTEILFILKFIFTMYEYAFSINTEYTLRVVHTRTFSGSAEMVRKWFY